MMLTRSLFRQLFREVNALERNCEARSLEITKEIKRFFLPHTSITSIICPHQVLRDQFEVHKFYTDKEDVLTLVNLGFSSLRQLRRRNQLLSSHTWSQKPTTVQFGVGQVIVHLKYGYRGVIVGWSEECAQSAEWQQTMGVKKLNGGPKQPFYHVLVDTRDRGPHPIRTYVAQENMTTRLSGPSVHRRQEAPVHHPEVEDYLVQFLPLEGRYIPSEELRNLYPED